MSVRKKVIGIGEPTEEIWWIADYTDGSGLRHQRRFKHKREAVALHDQMKVAIRAGTHVSLPNDLTLRTFPTSGLSASRPMPENAAHSSPIVSTSISASCRASANTSWRS